jgi:hypothetical protein
MMVGGYPRGCSLWYVFNSENAYAMNFRRLDPAKDLVL